MSSFLSQMKAFENLTTNKAEKVFRKTCFEISNSVISLTAVDSGRAKNNWFPDINKFSSETTEATNKQGSINLVAGATNRLQLGTTFTLSNNLPYIVKLEYGLYNPNSTTGKTVGGFSKQAPAGFVGVTLQKFDTILKNANKGII